MSYPTISIKEQIENLNSEVNNILSDNSSLNPESLMTIADTVKETIDVPSNELDILNEKILVAPIESNNDVLRAAIGSVADLKELLRSCHGILNQVYTQIASLDISDPRMIEAAAAFISSMKDTIQSFIDLYRDEQNFLHSIILKKIDIQGKKDLLKYKHELELKKNSTDISSTEVSYSQEEIMKMLNGVSDNDKR